MYNNLFDNSSPLTIDNIINNDNLTNFFDDNQLAYIADRVIRGYQIDEDSRAEWIENNRKGMDVAMQKIEAKNNPWPGCSNIKFPLIAEAANTYAARAIPELIQNDHIVKARDNGADPTGEICQRGLNISACMSYQLLVQSKDWRTSLVKSLYCLSVVGTIFKKVYYDPIEKRFMSELCTPDKVVVNNNTANLDSAPRITHIFDRSMNYIIERQRKGIYNEDITEEDLQPDFQDQDVDLELYEQQCWWDFDNDGYKEPYSVVIHLKSRKILRIVSLIKKIDKDKDSGKILKIIPKKTFVDYHYIRAFDGSFYSIGFGTYLLPLNAAASSLMNQLIDAGTLANTAPVLLGKGLRIRDGEIGFKPGQARVCDNAAGTDLKNNVFPFPVKEPSQTLFNLLELIIQTCKDLASTTDVMQGRQPAQNVANSTVSSLLEQGNKSFVAINSGVLQSLGDEFQLLYESNFENLTPKEYQQILNNPDLDPKKDFAPDDFHIKSVADPSFSSDSQRIQKASVLQSLPTVDHRAADLYLATAMKLDASQIKVLFPPQDPNAAAKAPENQKLMAEASLFQAQTQEIMANLHIESEKNQIQAAKLQIQMQQTEAFVKESMARINKMMGDHAVNEAKVQVTASKVQQQTQIHQDEFTHKVLKDQADASVNQQNANTAATKVGLASHIDAAKVLVAKDKVDVDREKINSKEEETKDAGKDNETTV